MLRFVNRFSSYMCLLMSRNLHNLIILLLMRLHFTHFFFRIFQYFILMQLLFYSRRTYYRNAYTYVTLNLLTFLQELYLDKVEVITNRHLRRCVLFLIQCSLAKVKTILAIAISSSIVYPHLII